MNKRHLCVITVLAMLGRFMKCHGFGPHTMHNGIYNSCNTTLRRYICAPSINIQNQDMLMYE
jgi:hypothetical protein